MEKGKVSGQRAYALMRQVKSIIGEIYHMAVLCKLSQEEVSKQVNDRVYNGDIYYRLPIAEQRYLQGYRDSRYEELDRHHLMFVYEVDGERLSLKECREKRIPYEKMTTQNSKTVWIADRTKTYFP